MTRKWWMVASAAVLVLLGVALALPLLINAETYRPMIQSQLEQALRRPVEIGAVKLSVFPLALRAERVTIGEAAEFASSRPFVTANSVGARVELLPLLRGDVRVTSFELLQPSIELIRSSQGKWNVESLGEPAQQDSASSGSAVQVELLRVMDGQLAITGENGRRTVYDRIQISLRGFQPHRPFDLALSVGVPDSEGILALEGTATPAAHGGVDFAGKLSLNNAPLEGLQKLAGVQGTSKIRGVGSGGGDVSLRGGAIATEGQVVFSKVAWESKPLGPDIRLDFNLHSDPRREQFKVTYLRLSQGPFAVTATGGLDAGTAKPQLDLQVAVDRTPIQDLLRLLESAGMLTPGSPRFQGWLTARAAVLGPAEAPALSGTLEASSLEAAVAGVKDPLRVAQFTLDFAPQQLRARPFQLQWADTRGSGEFSLKDFSHPVVDFTLDFQRLNVDQLSQLSGPAPATPADRSPPRAQGANMMEKLGGGGRLRAAEVTYSNFNLRQVSAVCKFDRGVIRLDPVGMSLFDGRLAGNITADTRASHTAYTIKAKLADIDANQLLAATSPVRQVLFGKLNAALDARFVSRPGEDIVRSLTGGLQMQLQDGRLAGANLLSEMSTIGRFAGLTKSAAAVTNLIALSGTFQIENGVARTDDLRLDLGAASAGATGTVNLVDQSVNLKLLTVFGRDFSQRAGGSQVAGWMNTVLGNDKGELVIPALVTGALGKPRFAPDSARLAEMKLHQLTPDAANPQKAVQSVIEAIRQPTPEGGGSRLGGVLDALRGKKKEEPKSEPGALDPPSPPKQP